MGPGQTRALASLGPRYILPFEPPPPGARSVPLDTVAAFGRTAPLVVEIGFGTGQATADFARLNPALDVLGIEVHPPGVGALLQVIAQHELNNVRIVRHDAVEVLEHGVGNGRLAGVHCFFPDPWHKARHHKRRLIQPPFVRLLAERLVPGGYLHLATDWEPYARQMLQVLDGESLLVNQSTGGYVPRPSSRTLTRFEQRGLRLGHGVWDLLYRRTDVPAG